MSTTLPDLSDFRAICAGAVADDATSFEVTAAAPWPALCLLAAGLPAVADQEIEAAVGDYGYGGEWVSVEVKEPLAKVIRDSLGLEAETGWAEICHALAAGDGATTVEVFKGDYGFEGWTTWVDTTTLSELVRDAVATVVWENPF